MSTSSNGTLTQSALTPQEKLQARLSDPRTVESLNALLDKLDLMAFTVNALDGFLRRGDQVVESLSDSVKDLKKMTSQDANVTQLAGKLPQLAKAGVQFANTTESQAFANLSNSGLLDKLGDPHTIAALKTLLDKVELAAFALTALDGLLKRGDTIIESVGASVKDFKKLAPNVDVQALGAAGQDLVNSGLLDKTDVLSEALVKLADSGLLEKFPELTRTAAQLVDSGIFNEKTVGVLATAGKTLADSYATASAAPTKQIGMGGLIKALSDPDIQRTLGLLLGFAKNFGQKLK
ncbi:MAG: DUF1641 domain-containing protein [Anaerolineae bacterium]|nr:DUF1641 domain-containing protein [Anaerolineae bacterium]